jgi:hypothetical protein
MSHKVILLWSTMVALPLMVAGCSDDDDDMGSTGRGGTSGRGGTLGMGGTSGASGRGGTSGASGMGGTAGSGGTTDGSAGTAGAGATGGDGGVTTRRFRVRIENRSGTSALPAPISPGVFVAHRDKDPLFTAGAADRREGLEAIAEDGVPTMLAASLAAKSGIGANGAFDTAVGATAAGPAMPGSAFEFMIDAAPGEKLSFASMFAQSNDVFLAPDGDGIDLFDAQGMPLAERDVSSEIALWDGGTEANEAPGMGPNQAPRQPAANTGPAEGVASRSTDSTRSLPIAPALARVSVALTGTTYTVSLENVSVAKGAFKTPLSPLFWATHSGAVSLFAAGAAPSDALESLAEDGAPAMLVSTLTGMNGVGDVGTVAAQTNPGQTATFAVAPTMQAPILSFVTMVGETNDVFLGTPPAGVALLAAGGVPRPAADVQAELERALALWDAGTEANEVPAAGANQAPRQAAPDTGPVDPDDEVRRYVDSTNDLAGTSLGGFASVVITHQTGLTFGVTVRNTSAATRYPANLSPLAWAVHNATFSLFTPGMPVSAGIQSVAEDGSPTMLATELSARGGVSSSAAVGAAPIMNGGSFSFDVTMTATHRFLSLASMVAPSNDTFMAFGPVGIELVTAAGAPRSNGDIATDVAAMLAAWDAGTEQNQAGAGGPSMAGPGLQPAPNTGASEGDGRVRALADPVWSYPRAVDVVKVTITPQ